MLNLLIYIRTGFSVSVLFLQKLVHEELDLGLVFDFCAGVFEVGFEFEGIGLFLESDAEVDVVDEPAANSPSVGGWFGGRRHAVAHEDRWIVGGNDRDSGVTAGDLFGFVRRLRPPLGKMSFLRISYIAQWSGEGFDVGVGSQQGGDLVLPEFDIVRGLTASG